VEGSAYIGGVIAGLVYFIVGVRLIRSSWSSQKSPELLLGVSLLLWGFSYVCWQIPIAIASQPLTEPLFFAGRIFTHAGTIFFANFTWVVFRDQSRWARFLVFAIAIGLVAGVAGSIANGDWEGVQPASNPWWFVDWGAGFVAMAWVGVEGFIGYPKARQRLKMGLCDPIACNRYLIWGITSIVWATYQWITLLQHMEFEATGVWSAGMDTANGVIETTGVALVWLNCFPPAIYRNWINGAAPEAEAAEG
jgi:hypothetical protein